MVDGVLAKGLKVEIGGRIALDGASAFFPSGSMTALMGPNGSGKTTLMRALAGLEKIKEGETSFPSPRFFRAFVPQSPRDFMLSPTLRKEIEMWGGDDLKAFDIVGFLGIGHLLDEPFSSLSDGQVQICSLAAALCSEPDFLLLDEPCSSLDRVSRRAVLSLISDVNSDLAATVVMSGHGMDVLQACPRLAAMDSGKVIVEGRTRETLERLWAMGKAESVPNFQKCFLQKGRTPPLTVAEARGSGLALPSPKKASKTEEGTQASAMALKVKNLAFGHSSVLNVQNLSFEAKEGEVMALVGGNGSGKTTILKLLAGILRPVFGRVWIKKGPICFLPQDPEPFLGLEEGKGLGKRDLLSGSSGERQMRADLLALNSGRGVVLMDEPEKSLDSPSKERLGNLMLETAKKGSLIIFSTHDPEFCASFSQRSICLLKGEAVFDGSSRALVGGLAFFTTPFNRAFPHKGILTMKDVSDA